MVSHSINNNNNSNNNNNNNNNNEKACGADLDEVVVLVENHVQGVGVELFSGGTLAWIMEEGSLSFPGNKLPSNVFCSLLLGNNLG